MRYHFSDPSMTGENIRDALGECDRILGSSKALPGELQGPFKRFRERGVFDMNGTHLPGTRDGQLTEESWQALFNAAGIYSDKRFETFRMFLVSPKFNIREQVSVTSGIPNYCKVPFVDKESNERGLLDLVIDECNERGLSLVVCHNHPSGNTNPSDDDKNMTRQYDELLTERLGPGRFLGHIILDHTSYSRWSPLDGWKTVGEEIENDEVHGLYGLPVRETRDLDAVAREVNRGARWNGDFLPVVFTDRDDKVCAFSFYHKKDFEKTFEMKRRLVESARTCGALQSYVLLSEKQDESTKDILWVDEYLGRLIRNDGIVDCGIRDTKNNVCHSLCVINGWKQGRNYQGLYETMLNAGHLTAQSTFDLSCDGCRPVSSSSVAERESVVSEKEEKARLLGKSQMEFFRSFSKWSGEEGKKGEVALAYMTRGLNPGDVTDVFREGGRICDEKREVIRTEQRERQQMNFNVNENHRSRGARKR